MEEVIVLEILDRSGEVRARRRLDVFPITIGRAYSADVILDDRYVSPEHVRIRRDADGTLIAEDLDSTNGLYHLSPLLRTPQVQLHSDTLIRIGQTVLRFRRPDYPVAPAVPIDRHTGVAPLAGRAWAAPVNGLALTAFVGIDWYLGMYQRFSAGKLLTSMFALALVLLTWCGMWSLASRIIAQRFRFLEHCAMASFWALMLGVFGVLRDYGEFAFAAGRSADIAGWVGTTAILAGLTYGHIRLCSSAPRRPLLLGAALVSCALVGLIGSWVYLLRSDFSLALDYPGALKPPSFRVAPAESVTQFFEASRSLQSRADALAKE